MEWMMLLKGGNRIRILGDPELRKLHYDNGIKQCDGHRTCPYCISGKYPIYKYDIPVFDHYQGMCKMLSVGGQIYKELIGCISEPGLGDPTEYDISINRDGVGLYIKYDIVVFPKSPLFPVDQEKVNDFLNTLYGSTPAQTSSIDRCKACNGPGEVKGMACICKDCGQLIWGC